MPPAICAERAAVEGVLKGDYGDLFPSAHLLAPGPGELDGALARFGPGRQQEDLLESFGRDAGKFLDAAGPDLRGKAVIVKKPVVRLVANGPPDFGMGVAGVGDDHAGRPVEPHVSPAVVDLDPLGPIPQHQGLPAHRKRFEPAKLLKDRDRLRHGDIGSDAAVLRMNRRDFAGKKIVGSHSMSPCGVRGQ